jgi:glycosyltransferase involved in cell wall biosynthesis
LKIVHLIYSEQVAGAEKYLLDLLPCLQDESIECHLLCITPVKDAYKFTGLCEQLNSKGVQSVLLNGTLKNFLSIARSISKYLSENKIKYLHAHLFKSDLLAVLVKKLFNRKIVLLSTKHGYEEKYCSNYHRYHGRIHYNLYYFISKYLLANIDKQVAVSKAMSDLYFQLKLTPERLHFIHHGINIKVLQQTEDGFQYRYADQQLLILGRIEEVKGHTYLFNALPDVIKVFPELKLLVIGNGTQQEILQQQAISLGIENNILFLGFQQNPYPFMANSDILVSPSLYESFGLVFIEAFAMQLPVIAFDAPAANEIISNGETGLLVPVYSSCELAQKVIFLLQNPAKRKHLANAAFEKYTAYFNTARMVKETAAWYRSVITE